MVARLVAEIKPAGNSLKLTSLLVHRDVCLSSGWGAAATSRTPESGVAGPSAGEAGNLGEISLSQLEGGLGTRRDSRDSSPGTARRHPPTGTPGAA